MIRTSHKVHVPLWTLTALLAWTAAGAQSFGNPAGLAPDTPGINTGKPADDHANANDKLFVRQAALGGRAEVEMSRLAQKKAGAPPVKDFAQRMVNEHSKANERLMKLGRGLDPQIPDGLDAQHKIVMSELQEASGTDFDAAYLSKQIGAHQSTANLLQWEISVGQNAALKEYAMDLLPDVLEHLQIAKDHMAALAANRTKDQG